MTSVKLTRVNCPFYFKIGACRHGDKCCRVHIRPVISQTLLLSHMYNNPPEAILISEGKKVSDEELKMSINHFENFYEEVFLEFTKYGEVEDMLISDNLGDHLIGNVYVKYHSEEEAEKAMKALSGRYYQDLPIICEFSPVTNFKECRCKQYEEGSCARTFLNRRWILQFHASQVHF